MKTICLNTWGCRESESLFKFIKENNSADIYCFQEVLKSGIGKTSRDELKSGYEDIAKLLPNHKGYFSEYGEGGYYSEKSRDLDFKYGIACFVNSKLNQKFVQGVRLYDLETKWTDYSGRFAAGAAMAVEAGDYAVLNIHGLWQGGIKKDTEAKLVQSKQIISLAEIANGKKIICGDFNLLPETKSIQMLGDVYTDLIQKYKIVSTRSTLYPKELRYSDYAFVDSNISINRFLVPDVTISDHLPLVIDFD